MDISSIGASYADLATQIAEAKEQAEIEALYTVKLFKMAQQTNDVIAGLLEDTVEISKEAMQKFMSERGRSI